MNRIGLLLCSLLFSLLAFSGCSKSDTNTSDEIQFAVVDSLIDTAVEFSDENLRISPPRGWFPAPDSVQAQLAVTVQTSSITGHPLTLHRLFMDTANFAGLLVCRVGELQLQQDTAGYFQTMRQTFLAHYGDANVHTDQFWHNGILVKQMLTTDSMLVRFQLTCLQPQKDAIQLLYYMPRGQYESLVHRLESSIGSLKPIS